jgi:hypothetical protein
MYPIRKSEVLRYLGYRKSMVISEETDALVDECIADLKKVIQPSSTFARFPITRHDGILDIEGMIIDSESLSRNLKDCDEVYLFAATAGIGIDRMIKRAELTNVAKAAIYQATGAEIVECICDELNDRLKERVAKEGLRLKPRFSPGYGDTSLELQKDFERLLHMSEIGIHLNESLLMVPSKSVTAFIGITKSQAKEKTGCAACTATNCTIRREGL